MSVLGFSGVWLLHVGSVPGFGPVVFQFADLLVVCLVFCRLLVIYLLVGLNLLVC